MNLVFVSQRFESFAGHSGSGGDGRRTSLEVVSSFLVLKLLHTSTFFFFTLSLSHTHTHTLNHSHGCTEIHYNFPKIFMPVVNFSPMETTGVFNENHRGRWAFHTNCCILKQLEILQFFSPSTLLKLLLCFTACLCYSWKQIIRILH